MSVFLGTNGAGKTTFFDVFGFLCDALQSNVTIALNKRGGFAEVISRGCDLNKDFISFKIKFRIDKINKEPISYFLEIGFADGKVYINKEILKYDSALVPNQKFLLDFTKGEGTAIKNEGEFFNKHSKQKIENQKVSSQDILAIKGLGQFENFKVISSFRALLEKWYVSSFKIDLGRNISEIGISEHLSISGNNLAQVTKYIYDYHRPVFDTILEKLPKRIPGIAKVEAKETEEGMIVLKFQDKSFSTPFLSKFVSDGTIKMFAYLILLYDPNPHPLLCIEEPENYLHPDLLLELCEEIREYSERGGQVLVSTHSPDFVNGVNIDELYFLTKENGFTQVKSAIDDEQVKELAEDNQLGWLWRNHYIKGANLR